MADTWFRTPGVHPLPLTRPLGYETDEGGRCTGIRTCRIKPGPGPDDRTPAPVPESECVLNVDLVIEAMGLEVADTLRQALDELPFSADGFLQTSGDSFNVPGFDNLYAVGALINGGASIAQCVAEGMRAAAEINGAEISTEPEQG